MPIQRVTFPERERIELYVRMKKKKTWIAKKLGRDLSVIKREIRRNSSEHLPYVARSAQGIADRNAKKTNTRKLEKEKHRELKKFVETSLEKGHSPEQIAGRMRVRDREHSLNKKMGRSVLKLFISTSTPGPVAWGDFSNTSGGNRKFGTDDSGENSRKP